MKNPIHRWAAAAGVNGVKGWRAALVICAGGALAFWPALGAGFAWDDGLLIAENALVRGPFARIWTTTEAYDFWPLSTSAFWVQWRLFGAFAPAYHCVNLALHLCAAILLFRVLEKASLPGASIAGLLFAVHPVAVESASWISEQKNTLSAALALAAVLAWLGDKRGLSLLVFVLALLAKGSVVIVPVFLAGWEAWRGRGLEKRGLLHLPGVGRTLPLFGVAVVAGAGNLWFQHHNAMGASSPAHRGIAERCASAGWALLAYEQKAFVPVRLGTVYPDWPQPPLLYASIALVAAVAIALWLSRSRPLQLAFACHAVAVAPVLGLVDLAYFAVGPISNHLQYLALCAPAALYGALLARMRPSLVFLPVAGLALFTSVRAAAWKSDETLWQSAAREQPDSAYAHAQLSVALAGQGRFSEAARELEEQIRLTRDPAAIHVGRAQLAWFRANREEAVAEARAALESSADGAIRSDAAQVLLAAGLAGEAAAVLEKLVREVPMNAGFAYRLGAALARDGRLDEAERMLTTWSSAHPGSPRVEEALRAVRERLTSRR